MSKVKMKVHVEVEAKFLRVEAGVRYWEDGQINGERDDEDHPKMPFASNGLWCPTIDIDTGTIIDWPVGTVASIHYKVCDDGKYILLDAGSKEITSIDGYVPSIMCPKKNGYGDYIIMDIGADGKIDEWVPRVGDFEGVEE